MSYLTAIFRVILIVGGVVLLFASFFFLGATMNGEFKWHFILVWIATILMLAGVVKYIADH